MPQQVDVKVLKGGRVRIHWFVLRESGPIHTSARHVHGQGVGTIQLGGHSGYIACQPQRKQLSLTQGGRIQVCPCSMEFEVVTCPECMATVEFQKAVQQVQSQEGVPSIAEQKSVTAASRPGGKKWPPAS